MNAGSTQIHHIGELSIKVDPEGWTVRYNLLLDPLFHLIDHRMQVGMVEGEIKSRKVPHFRYKFEEVLGQRTTRKCWTCDGTSLKCNL